MVFVVIVAAAPWAVAADDTQPRAGSAPATVAAPSQALESGDKLQRLASISPPRDSLKSFVQFMKNERQEEDKFLEQRFLRCTTLIQNKDLNRDREIRAFLLTPERNFAAPGI